MIDIKVWLGDFVADTSSFSHCLRCKILQYWTAKLRNLEKNEWCSKFSSMRPYDRYLSQFEFFEQIMVVSWCGISKSHNHIIHHGSKPLSGFLISTVRKSCEISLDLYFYCFCKRSQRIFYFFFCFRDIILKHAKTVYGWVLHKVTCTKFFSTLRQKNFAEKLRYLPHTQSHEISWNWIVPETMFFGTLKKLPEIMIRPSILYHFFCFSDKGASNLTFFADFT